MIKEKKSMAEIHAIMEQLHDKRAGMNSDDVLSDIRHGAEKAKKEFGIALKRQSLKQVVVNR